MWCGRGYPPAIPSREHLLADYLGVPVTLPSGVVCKGCNERLNESVDRPLKAIYQPLITFLRLRSGKRPRAASVPVQVATQVGPVPATLRADGRVRFSTRRFHAERADGVYRERWMCPDGDGAALIESMKKRLGASLRVKQGTLQLGEMTTTVPVSGKALMRATVRAGMNYVAWKRPDLLCTGLFTDAVRFVLDDDDSTTELHGVASPLTQNIDARTLRPVHTVLVSAVPGGESWTELLLFDFFICKVRVAERWQGPALGIYESFRSSRFVRTQAP